MHFLSIYSEAINKDASLITEASLMHDAAELDEERDDLIRVLLDAGADPDYPNRFNWTPLQVASEKGHVSIIRMLLEAGADIHADLRGDGHRALMRAITYRNREAIVLLLNAGADPKLRDNGDRNALNRAAYRGGLADIVRLLLSTYGADVDYSNVHGNTALHEASLNGHADTVKVLLQAGASIDILNNNGRSAFHFVTESFQTPVLARSLVTLRILLDAAAAEARMDILQVKDNFDKTPLELVIARGVARDQRERLKFAYPLTDAGASTSGLTAQERDWFFAQAVRDQRYGLAKDIGSTVDNIHGILPNDQVPNFIAKFPVNFIFRTNLIQIALYLPC